MSLNNYYNILWTLIKVIYTISLSIFISILCVVSVVWPIIMLFILMTIVGTLRDSKRHSLPGGSKPISEELPCFWASVLDKKVYMTSWAHSSLDWEMDTADLLPTASELYLPSRERLYSSPTVGVLYRMIWKHC